MTRDELAVEVADFIKKELPEGEVDLEEAQSELNAFFDTLEEEEDVEEEDEPAKASEA